MHTCSAPPRSTHTGVTPQSRSRQPTHTWNTATVPTVDFGGRLANQVEPDDQVVAALARVPDTTMAAVDDPWIADRELPEIIAVHQAELDRQPPDRQHALRDAGRTLHAARATLTKADDAVAATRQKLEDLGPFAGLTRDGRARRRRLEEELNTRQTLARSEPPARSPAQTAGSSGSRVTRPTTSTTNTLTVGDARPSTMRTNASISIGPASP